jgi:hypothetical protein
MQTIKDRPSKLNNLLATVGCWLLLPVLVLVVGICEARIWWANRKGQ